MIQKNNKFADLLINLVLALFSVAAFVPFLLMLIVSFSDARSVMLKGYSFTPDSFSTAAYQFVLSNNMIFNAYGVTLLVTVVGTALSVFICLMAGYSLSVQKLKYRNKFSMFFYIPMVFQVSLVPWYLIISKVFMLKNTLAVLILPILVSPFNIFLIRNYYRGIPSSLAESAEIDGATPFVTFLRIMLPLGGPIIATVTLFVALRYWNDYVLTLWFVEEQTLQPIQFILFKIKSLIQFLQSHTSRGGRDVPFETVQAATMFITIGPIILVYPFVQKYFIKGITVGAVKG